ncbi:Peroxisomal acyl-coenzyme A oxidase 3 [Seminavis robusta]|uniref:Peroxisomal acyl-coenzyme A oxidase 3 n=1 Tax=Seminavis robusta TaxID=568900 RepID=A0A9N8HAG9_9STRA|nr:Peroxisomal acyl-coenzyme A oxidase 3 [Seminavis robusta]|eukprot:Sro295_g110550.1 Peroxisomal acyl-coenzyme A oxidase 3 (536) ;mRNA; r:72972-74683
MNVNRLFGAASRMGIHRLSSSVQVQHRAIIPTGTTATTGTAKRFFADRIVVDDSRGDDSQWAHDFTEATVGVAQMDPKEIDYGTSAQRLRELIKSGLLLHTDLRDHPERFFLAHRILAQHSSAVGPGFWVRFTVHYNLCAGTVLALGTDPQVEQLQEMQTQGLLGCFSLTEKLAGVSSGLVVNTTATWQPESQTFLLNSPDVGAHKNWISQGLVADKTVVVADLTIQDKSYGPHAFLIDLRQDGDLVSGVATQDMGIKTVGNDLDNAAIAFDNVTIPKSALLSKFADIDADGNYVQKVKGIPVFHMIGQRLFTGRVAVAQAAMAFRRGLFDRTKQFSDQKQCWAPHGKHVVLSDIPHINALYEKAHSEAAELDAFVGECERRLCDCLRNNKLPSLDLVEAIACAKVKCVEGSIRACHQLQQDVGSYALMGGTGFENIDFLTCCKFAEGDSRILQQKMSRDRMKRFQNQDDTPEGVEPQDWATENQACADLQDKMLHIMTTENVDKHMAWDRCFEEVYELSEVIMARTMKSFMAKA